MPELSYAVEVPMPGGCAPYAVAVAADGVVWASLVRPAGLARLDPAEALATPGAGVTLHEFASGAGRPMQVAAGAAGSLWYARTDDRLIRRDAAGREHVTELPAGASPYGVCALPSGDVWFTAPGLNRIGCLSADGALRMTPSPGAGPAMAAATADGAVWVTLNAAGALARCRGDDVDVVPLPSGAAPVGIAASGDTVWYCDIAAGRVGRVGQDGTVEQIALGDPACRPHAVAADPDGGCWVTLWAAGALARIAPDGAVTHHRLPGAEPHGLALTRSHVWVALESGSLAAVPRHRGVA